MPIERDPIRDLRSKQAAMWMLALGVGHFVIFGAIAWFALDLYRLLTFLQEVRP